MGDPSYWIARYTGGMMPVRIYGQPAVIGEYYVASLICQSSEYVVYIPQDETDQGGDLWVLYDTERLFFITLPDTATEKPAWEWTGAGGGFLAMSKLQSTKLAIKAGVDTIWYSADTAATWNEVVDAAEFLSDIKFDATTEGLGFTVLDPPLLLSDSDKDALIPSYPGNGDYTPAAVHASYTSFFASIKPIVVYRTTNGGASWLTETVGYLGSHVPTRISGSSKMTEHTEGAGPSAPCNYPSSTICTWKTFGDLPLGDPCFSGSVVNIVAGTEDRDIVNRRTNGTFVINQYGLCDSSAFDRDELTFAPFSGANPIIAPHHDGSGYYVSVGATYRGNTYTGGYAITETMTPFLYAPGASLSTIYTTILFQDGGSTWEVEPGDLSSGSSFERLTVALETDRLDSDVFYAISSSVYLYRLKWVTQGITNISPISPGTINNISNVLCTEAGSLIVPITSSGNTVFRIYRSDDQGDSWTFVDLSSDSDDIGNETCRIDQASDETIFYTLYGGKVVTSTDDGASWVVSDAIAGLPTTDSVTDVTAS